MTPGVRAAVEVGRRFGVHTEVPLLLQETNNTVVWLRPHQVIAKVGTRANRAEVLTREHYVARELAAMGAPIAGPFAASVPVRDEESGFVVTLWNRLEHDPKAEATGSSVGRSLADLHEALDGCSVAIPDFRTELQDAQIALSDHVRVAALAPLDRHFLRTAFTDLLEMLDRCVLHERPLHGEPHSGNVLHTPLGLRWIDFEGTCRGPLEWDLAFLPDEGVRTFADVDEGLLALLRVLNSARVATWCAALAGYPEMRKHGEHHLGIVRRRWPPTD